MKWRHVRIADFCRTLSGGTPSTHRKQAYYGGSVPWVKSGELRDDELSTTEEYLTHQGVKESSAKLIPPDSVLVAMYGATVGKTALLKIAATTNQAICSVIPQPTLALSRYVWFAVRSKVKLLVSRRVGGAQPNINQRIIRELVLPLPPLSEQRKIVELLDQADALRKRRAAADQKAERILPALFYKMFGDPATNPMGWDIKPLSEVAEIGTILVDPNKAQYLDLPHIGGDNIEKDSGRILDPKIVRNLSLKSGKFIFSPEHVLYCKIRPYLNKVSYPRFSGLCSADIYPLMPIQSTISQWYLVALLRSRAFLDYATVHSERLRMPKLNREQLGGFGVPIPPQNLVSSFTTKAADIDSFHAARLKSGVAISSLFTTMLHRAFSGELTAKWREAHMQELLREMEIQARELGLEEVAS